MKQAILEKIDKAVDDLTKKEVLDVEEVLKNKIPEQGDCSYLIIANVLGGKIVYPVHIQAMAIPISIPRIRKIDIIMKAEN